MTENAQRFTIVSFHAHPDDEALLTSGTLARAAAEGHRVVLVVATVGERGLTAGGIAMSELGRRRTRELEASCAAIGAARLVQLGYPDSGYRPRTPEPAGALAGARPGARVEVLFADVDPDDAAPRLASLLRQEEADVLTSYDPSGGYGHPDHVQVHQVGIRAARLAETPVVLEATVDRQLISRATRAIAALSLVVPMPELPDVDAPYTAHAELTHRVDVRSFLDAKERSLRAHASQRSSDTGPRTLSMLLNLPRPVRRLLLGHEWFREVGRAAPRRLLDDVFASLRP